MRRLAILLGLSLLAGVPGNLLPGGAQAQAVIDPRVFEQLAASSTGEARFLVYLAAQADLHEAEQVQDRVARKMMVASALASTARSSQREVRSLLARLQTQGLVARNI